jgi:hypothetical protein
MPVLVGSTIHVYTFSNGNSGMSVVPETRLSLLLRAELIRVDLVKNTTSVLAV